ncbi:TonB-dependent receptor [beta proteobacterium MWH-UniP1]
MSKKSPLVASALALAVSSAFAQSATGSNNPLYQLASLDPVVVSAARYEQPLSAVLPSVSVITRDEIEKSQAPTLADLLQGEAGFEFGRNGGLGSITSFFLRGQDSKGVVVLIDGARAPVDGIGALRITDFPLSQIDRVEILRGNSGALYGEAAVGGVISIFTRASNGAPSAYGSAMYGSRDTHEVTAGFGGMTGSYKFNVTVGSYDTAGFSAMNSSNSKVNPDKDGYKKDYASLSFEKQLTPSVTVGLRAHSTKTNADYDSKDDTASTEHYEKKDTDIFSVYSKMSITDSLDSSIDFYNSEVESKNFKNSADNGRYKSINSGVRWSNGYEVSGSSVLSFGVDLAQERHHQYYDPYEDPYDVDKDTSALFAGLTVKRGPLTVQGNVRRDFIDIKRNDASSRSESEQNNTSKLFGVGYQLTDTSKLTSTWSSGFRAPSAYDVSTNKDIKSEKYKSAEIGFVFSNKDNYARVVYFDTSTDNAIDYDWNQWPSPAINILKTENKGFEFTLKSVWQGNNIRLSAVSQDPKNVATGEQLSRRAKYYGTFDISRRLLGYEVGGRLYASGSRDDSEWNTTRLGGYGVFSLYADRSLATNLVARLRFENVFDKQYEIAGGYNSVPRGVFLTVQYQPKN